MNQSEFIKKRNRITKTMESYAELKNIFIQLVNKAQEALKKNNEYKVTIKAVSDTKLTFVFLEDTIDMTFGFVSAIGGEVYGELIFELNFERSDSITTKEKILTLFFGENLRISDSIEAPKIDISLEYKMIIEFILTEVFDRYLGLKKGWRGN